MRSREDKLERDYQQDVIARLRRMFPGCIILKNDTLYQQGIPDWTVLWINAWAILEIKRSARARQQPNQAYFVDLANEMCFGAFIYPENEDEVLDELQQTFRARRATRLPRSK